MGRHSTVVVNRRFQRSIRLDTDLNDINALHGFICPPTFANALATLATQSRESGQGAYTWTGPFGGGKSSLAVVLSALLTKPDARRRAALKITGDAGKNVVDTFKPGRYGYRSVAVVGRKQDCAEQLAEALRRDNLIRKTIKTNSDGGKALLETIKSVAARRNNAGLLIILDELGKILEAAAAGHGDLHFLQELAELASRSGGRLIVVGILHQAFGEYTGKLAQRMRNEWMKVQGRFVDVPLATLANEQLALLGEAIESKSPTSAVTSAERLVEDLTEGNKGRKKELSSQIAACWPLNGVTAGLLGPISRRRFGQNQRSIFSFLNSAEPLGFQSFIASASSDETYEPAMLWDYLRANMEPSILASPDGNRWATALEALERCEAKGGGEEHSQLGKTIAIIDLFREHSGIRATRNILKVATSSISPRQQSRILKDLEKWSIVAFRRHLDAFAIHAGSDFDIEAAIQEERSARVELDLLELETLADLKPVIAKRHYHETGALRWATFRIAKLEELNAIEPGSAVSEGAIGEFIIAVPSSEISQAKTDSILKAASKREFPTLTVGLLPESEEIVDLAEELVALQRIRRLRGELAGDAIARREVAAHLAVVRQSLASTLHEAILSIAWYSRGKKRSFRGLAEMHAYASELADETYCRTPKIQNELLNRTRPSSTAVAARRALLHAMVANKGEDRLGIEGYPADGGLFESILAATGIYQQRRRYSPQPAFYAPGKKCKSGLGAVWEAADGIVDLSEASPVSLNDIYEIWRNPPYGVKDGLLPVLGLAYLLTRTDRVAVYLDGAFRPEIDDFVVDRLQQEPNALRIRKMNFGKLRSKVLEGIGDLVAEFDDADAKLNDPLIVARRLVAIVMSLPSWTQRTNTISGDAKRLRGIIQAASDPHRFLFDDLPAFAADTKDDLSNRDIAAIVGSIKSGLSELVVAYDTMLQHFRELLLSELGVALTKLGIRQLRERAQNVVGLTGDFRLDAFATRLAEFSKELECTEGVASLAANKPPRDWVDRDLDSARVEVAALCQQFKRAETFARVKGRNDTRHALAFMIGTAGSPQPIVEEFEIDDDGLKASSELLEELEEFLRSRTEKKEVVFAALAQLGTKLAGRDNTSRPSSKKLKKVS